MREVFCGVISQGVAPYFFMEEKICSFFGHREIEITDKLRADIQKSVEQAIECGCTVFYFGGYGDFDELCRRIVSKIKEDAPGKGLRSVYCVSQEKYLRKSARCFNREDYDEIIYLQPSFDWWYKSIYFRNCAMIDKSCFIVFYAKESKNSGAYKAYKYAMNTTNKTIINLYEKTDQNSITQEKKGLSH